MTGPKWVAVAVLVIGFALVLFGSFGSPAGTPSGDRIVTIGFALLLFAIAMALILNRKRVR